MLAPVSLACKYSTWHWVCQDTGEIRPFNCRSWSCPQHNDSMRWKWAINVASARPERMITLTQVPRNRSQATLGFSHLLQEVRHMGWDFQYARFLEVGDKTGMVHWHLAQKGDFIPQRWLSSHAYKNHLGYVTDIRKCFGAGPGWYLAKYITKDLPMVGWRKATTSRGWPRPKFEPDGNWELVRGLDMVEKGPHSIL